MLSAEEYSDIVIFKGFKLDFKFVIVKELYPIR